MRSAFDFRNDSLMYPTLKQLGHRDWWLMYRVRKGGSYTTSKTIGKYKVEYEEDERYPNLYIWNPDSPCVMIGFDKVEKIGVLNRLIYNPKCTIDGKMARGEDTKNMLRFAFDIAKQYGIEKIQLMDMSTFDCNGKKVDLAIYNLFKYGKTWYERCFQFYPTGLYKDEFEEMRASLPSSDQPCDYYTHENIRNLAKTYRLDVLHKTTFEKTL
jgi:hypothetical protein